MASIEKKRKPVYTINENARDSYLNYLLETPDSSLSERKRSVSNFISFLDKEPIPITELTTEHLDKFVNSLMNGKITGNPLSAKTIHQKIYLIKTFIRFLFEERMIESHPDRIFTTTFMDRLPKTKETEPKYVSQKDIQLILENCPDRYQALFYLAYDSGARISELLNIKVIDLSFENGTITINESNPTSIRTVYLSAITIDKLRIYLRTIRPKKKSNFLFINYYGKHFSSRTIQIFLRGFSFDILGYTITPHYFRSTCAIHMLENGARIRAVKKIVGWKNIQTVERYAKFVEKRLGKNLIQPISKTKTHPLTKSKEEVIE